MHFTGGKNFNFILLLLPFSSHLQVEVPLAFLLSANDFDSYSLRNKYCRDGILNDVKRV